MERKIGSWSVEAGGVKWNKFFLGSSCGVWIKRESAKFKYSSSELNTFFHQVSQSCVFGGLLAKRATVHKIEGACASHLVSKHSSHQREATSENTPSRHPPYYANTMHQVRVLVPMKFIQSREAWRTSAQICNKSKTFAFCLYSASSCRFSVAH